jgi:hypothetical protein
MSAPLDPASARGAELADRLTQVFAEVRLAIWERSKPPKTGTPAPSAPPRPKPKPVGPAKPNKAQGRAA